MQLGAAPALKVGRGAPALKLPQPVGFGHSGVFQLPAVKFMPAQLFTLQHHKAVLPRCGCAIAQAQGTAPRAEGQQSCHGMGSVLGVMQLLAEQQQPAALRINRQAVLMRSL